jgi:hypothetical protein
MVQNEKKSIRAQALCTYALMPYALIHHQSFAQYIHIPYFEALLPQTLCALPQRLICL